MDRSKNTTVKAEICFLSFSQEAGRHHPIDTGFGQYRPDHNFPWMKANEALIGQINFDDGLGKVYPGDTVTVEIAFISTPETDEKLRPGLQWSIKEGQRTVGTGRIIEIVNM